jgi:hypothetical protein
MDDEGRLLAGRERRGNPVTYEPAISPGTVSKILWHFTGGPGWNVKSNRQNSSPKPSAQAYENLKSILKSKALRLGGYKEVVKVVLPERRKIDPKTRKVEILRNVPVTLESAPICCLSDIPAPHLRYHAYRYGKFAIGFHRHAVIRGGFNPVFYTLDDTSIIRSIYEGFSALDLADVDSIRSAANDIESQVDDFKTDHGDSDLDVGNDVWEITSEVDSVEATLSTARDSLGKFVAFVKTFDRTEFGTIYCEREWRSTQEFRFKIDDIAMIVLPRRVGPSRYFQTFVEKAAARLRLPRRVPVVAWDDLVEH